jgi:hypothetical protein
LTIEQRLQDAVQSYWKAREKNFQKQIESGKIDAGTRGAVTGGTQMGALEVLVADILCEAGLKKLDVRSRTSLELKLPGYYRAEKKWDLIVISERSLCSQWNSRVRWGLHSAIISTIDRKRPIGSATCLWTAY